MVRSLEVLDAIGSALTSADRLPDLNSYVVVTADGQGRQADLSIPFAEVRTETGSVREEDASTAFVRFIENEDGKQIGRLFEFTFQMDVEVTVWTVQTAKNPLSEINEMGSNVETALYRYDSQSRDELLPDGDGGMASVTDFFVAGGYPTEDLGTRPSLRGWRQEISCRFRDRLDTVEEYGPGAYVRDVVSPGDGDFHKAYPELEDQNWTIEGTVPLET